MKKVVLIYGCIAGLIVSALMAVSMDIFHASGDFDNGMVYGYASMIIAFSLIFVGIKRFRDNYNSGVISFGKAFKVGMFITLIACTFYVVSWLISFYFFMPDFYDKYFISMNEQLKASGASAATIAEKAAQMKKMAEWSKNPLFVILMTYVEILPVGLLVTLIAALILKRKNANQQVQKV